MNSYELGLQQIDWVKEAKKKAEQEELEKVKFGDPELPNVQLFKYVGVMHSSDGDSLVAVNHRNSLVQV